MSVHPRIPRNHLPHPRLQPFVFLPFLPTFRQRECGVSPNPRNAPNLTAKRLEREQSISPRNPLPFRFAPKEIPQQPKFPKCSPISLSLSGQSNLAAAISCRRSRNAACLMGSTWPVAQSRVVLRVMTSNDTVFILRVTTLPCQTCKVNSRSSMQLAGVIRP